MTPVKAMCQMFQMSMFTTRVSLVSSITTLMAMASGMAMMASSEAQVMGDMPGQPMSTMDRDRPKRWLIASAAGPSWSFMRLTMSERPTKPTPKIRPERMALPGLTPTMMERMATKMGSMTEAPMSMIY